MRLPSLIGRYGVAVFVLAGALVSTIPTAHADPHGVFYTTIGQQQLFFNVLAALDQADYVEPATGTRSRDELAQKQRAAAQAGLTEAQKQAISLETEAVKETKTDLAGVLTRGITLEGYDLWTAYLAHQFALEVARRTATDEVVRIYCERGLGLPNCKDDYQGEGVNGADPPTQPAFVNNDPRRTAEVALGAAAALESDSTAGSYDQVEREKLLDPENKNIRPRPRNETVAALTRNIQGDTYKELASERLKKGALSTYHSATIDPTVFSDLDIDKGSGRVALQSQDENAQEYITRYTNKLAALIGLPGAFIDIAGQGAHEIATFQAIEEDRGSLADSNVLVSRRPDGVYTTAIGKVEVPARFKGAATEEAINALANTEQNLKYAPSRAESQPGDISLVDKPLAGQAVLGTSTGTSSSVLGTADTAQGQVAATQNTPSSAKDANTKDIHDAEKKSIPLNTNPISVHHEPGFDSLLKAIGYQGKAGGCGCANGTDEVGKKFGKGILRLING